MVNEPEQTQTADDTPDLTPQQLDFPCRTCGAKLTWSPEKDALDCAHCGTSEPVPRADREIVERALEHAGSAARGLGQDKRGLRCNNCGATVALDTLRTAEQCSFCGSSNVLAQDANRNLLRPESLVPLDVGRADVERNFRAWLRGLWFRPSALQRVRDFDALGVYVPYWTIDAAVHSDWSADSGYYYYVTVMVPVVVNGRTQMRPQRVRKIRWVPSWGKRDDRYDDLLVHASKGVPEALAAKLGAWNLAALVPYRPEYLAGWRAEEYQLDLEGAWQVARAAIVRQQERRCAGDVPGDTHRDLRVHNEISDVRWKHVLLPVWSLSYRLSGKTYTVLVHGQTGRVHGEAPLSWAKILALVGAVLALVALAFAVAALTR
jgi:DNA-directed RNA polymerase subunit RPC12/RpoP